MAKQTKGPGAGGGAGASTPFATSSGQPTAPTPTGSPSLTSGAVSPAPGYDAGDSGWDTDQNEIPKGGRVLKADPPSNTSGGGGLGNGGGLPFKNLK